MVVEAAWSARDSGVMIILTGVGEESSERREGEEKERLL
jgi:hypothetical protein